MKKRVAWLYGVRRGGILISPSWAKCKFSRRTHIWLHRVRHQNQTEAGGTQLQERRPLVFRGRATTVTSCAYTTPAFTLDFLRLTLSHTCLFYSPVAYTPGFFHRVLTCVCRIVGVMLTNSWKNAQTMNRAWQEMNGIYWPILHCHYTNKQSDERYW